MYTNNLRVNSKIADTWILFKLQTFCTQKFTEKKITLRNEFKQLEIEEMLR